MFRLLLKKKVIRHRDRQSTPKPETCEILLTGRITKYVTQLIHHMKLFMLMMLMYFNVVLHKTLENEFATVMCITT